MDIPIFISHYKKLTDRKKYLDNILQKENFSNIYWFEDIDRDTMTKEDLTMYKYDKHRWLYLNSTWGHNYNDSRELRGPEIANAITHIKIYKYIIDNNIEIALILEDDCILYDNFKKNLLKYIEQLPKNFDTCFIGDAFGWTVDNYRTGFFGQQNKNIIREDLNIYPMKCGHTADAYIISLEGAKKIYNSILPFCLPIDFEFNHIFITENVNNYWGHPALIHQGSEDVYKSSAGR